MTTTTPVRDRCAFPVNLGTLEDQEVLAWIGQFSHAGRTVERICERTYEAMKRIDARFPNPQGMDSIAKAADHLLAAWEQLIDGSGDLSLWLAARQADKAITTTQNDCRRRSTLAELITGDNADLTPLQLAQQYRELGRKAIAEIETLKLRRADGTVDTQPLRERDQSERDVIDLDHAFDFAVDLNKAAREAKQQETKNEAPAAQDAAEEPTPATETPEPASPQEAVEDEGDPDIMDIFVIRYAGECVKPDALYRSEHCERHGSLAIHVFESKLDAERVAVDAADGHRDCRFEVLQGRMVVDWAQPLSETRSVVVPAGTDPDAAVIPIAPDETETAA